MEYSRSPALQAREFCYNIPVLARRGSRREAGKPSEASAELRGEQPMRVRNPDKAIRFLRCGLRPVDATRKRCWNIKRRK